MTQNAQTTIMLKTGGFNYIKIKDFVAVVTERHHTQTYQTSDIMGESIHHIHS